MIFTLPTGEKREVADADVAEFIAKSGKPVMPTPADSYAQALAPTTKDEYVKLCGFNQFVDLYLPEINRFNAARLAAMTAAKQATP
jgi:hypothetical protein